MNASTAPASIERESREDPPRKGAARAPSPLNIAEANELLQSVSVTRFRMITKYDAKATESSANEATVEQKIVITVPDRDDPGKTIDVRFQFVHAVPLEHLRREPILTAIRETIKRVVAHEVDECLLVGDVRVFDPHTSLPGTIDSRDGPERCRAPQTTAED